MAKGNTKQGIIAPPARRTRGATQAVEVLPGRATGPRTTRGKRRSSANSLKHGIFAKAIVLKGESRKEYELLLTGLLDDWQPIGMMEETLVEKLSVLFWRYRRLIQAESAEIAQVAEFVEEDVERRSLRHAGTVEDLGGVAKGMLQYCTNPLVYGRAVELLMQLEAGIEYRGFDKDRDVKLLRKLYGPPTDSGLPSEFFSTYGALWSMSVESTEEGTEVPKYNLDTLKSRAQKAVREEIRRLLDLQKKYEGVEARRLEHTIKASVLPPEKTMDRLMRYEASLERVIDRTLTQLERLQRMRFGHSVPPPLKVDVSKSD